MPEIDLSPGLCIVRLPMGRYHNTCCAICKRRIPGDYTPVYVLYAGDEILTTICVPCMPKPKKLQSLYDFLNGTEES